MPFYLIYDSLKVEIRCSLNDDCTRNKEMLCGSIKNTFFISITAKLECKTKNRNKYDFMTKINYIRHKVVFFYIITFKILLRDLNKNSYFKWTRGHFCISASRAKPSRPTASLTWPCQERNSPFVEYGL